MFDPAFTVMVPSAAEHRPQSLVVMVNFRDGRLAGGLAISTYTSSPTHPTRSILKHVRIHEGHLRQGVGTMLMQAAHEKLDELWWASMHHVEDGPRTPAGAAMCAFLEKMGWTLLSSGNVSGSLYTRKPTPRTALD